MNEEIIEIGDKVILVNVKDLGTNLLRAGDIYTVCNSTGNFLMLTDGTFQEGCYAYRVIKIKEENKEMTAEQIRDEILRIDVRIEEAKRDIENAQNERNSLVEKLRERGFELSEQRQIKERLQKGDKAKIIDNTSSHYFPIGKEVKVSTVYDNYYDCVDIDGIRWCCHDRDVEKI